MKIVGSGCGAVGRAVASHSRGPGFESSHRQLLLNIYLLSTVCRKDENKEKDAGNDPPPKKRRKKLEFENLDHFLIQHSYLILLSSHQNEFFKRAHNKTYSTY